MAALDDILNTNNSGYTVTQSHLENDEPVKVLPLGGKKPEVKPAGNTAGTVTSAGAVAEPANEMKPTVDARMAQWDKEHPAPTRREVVAPEMSHNYDYKKILDTYQKEDREDPVKAKRQKWNESIAAIGDAVTSLVNAVGTSNGGNNMDYDPTQGMAANARKRYQDILAKQKEDRDKYLKLQLQAAQLEDADNMKKLSMYNTAQQKADSDYNTKYGQYLADRRAAASGYREDDKAEATAEYRKQTLAQGQQRIDNDKSYHNSSLGLQAQRNSIAASKSNEEKGNVYRLGGMQRKGNLGETEADTILSEMAAAGAIKKKEYDMYKNAGVGKAGDLLAKGAATEAGKKVLREKHGFK